MKGGGRGTLYHTSDLFGWSVAISADASAIAVGAWNDATTARGIFTNVGDMDDAEHWIGASRGVGSVYLYTYDGNALVQQAYIAPSAPTGPSHFGSSVQLSYDGFTLGVGAPYDQGAATDVNGDDSLRASSIQGAAFVYVTPQSSIAWRRLAYLKAHFEITNQWQAFAWPRSISLSGDGNSVSVGEPRDRNCGDPNPINGDPRNYCNGEVGPSSYFGSAYVFSNTLYNILTQ